MRKQVFLGLVWFFIAMQVSGQNTVTGIIVDEQNTPLEGASIVAEELMIGSIANRGGDFSLNDIPLGALKLKVSFIGYETYSVSIDIEADTELGKIILIRSPYQGEEVTISALKAGKKTPMAFTNMSKQEITNRNFGMDIPYIVSSTPSMITSSDAGHGIGYTSMRIRGTDANRINVTINGIPLNDAESQSVFWVDLPELASSTDQIQIQRGVGTSTNGAAAFGATVNMLTNLLNKDPYAKYNATLGSFNTMRNSISAGTGLINDKFSMDVRISDLKSDGYIDRSWTDLQSYYLSAAYYSEKSSVKFITFGGFEELYQSWGGVPSSMLSTNRTYNEMGLYTNVNGDNTAYENQVDHYDQVHYQLHYARRINRAIHLNAALHYTKGKGYYEQYESGEDYSFYGMKEAVIGGDTLTQTDLVRRKMLDNDFYGAIASVNYDLENSTLIIGAGWNRYYGLHFGQVIWAQYFGDNSIGHQWYEGIGDKTDWNIYSKYYYYVNDKFNTFVDLQIRGVDHIIEGTDANNRDVTQDHSFLFFNPKIGVNYDLLNGQRAFFSFARANREPNRNNYTDVGPAGIEPLHECMRDFEAGYMYKGQQLTGGVTLYFMDYNNQLVLTGQINEVGYPIMTNVKDSYRAGVEFEASYRITENLSWNMNLTLSRNQISDYTNYVDNWSYWDDPINEAIQILDTIGTSALAFSPSVIANNLLTFSPIKNSSISLITKYVGKQYIDNTSNENFILDPYFVNDLRISYTFTPNWAQGITLSLLLINLLNEKYETNAWLYRYYSGGEEYFMDGYYPQAGTHFMFSLNMSF